MMFQEPKLLHSMLSILADNIADYANFQIESGAQVIQVFDSWAGHLSPKDYDAFAAPYQVSRPPSPCGMPYEQRGSSGRGTRPVC
jgi:uroporphyrinogen-III decarboxylase